MSQIRIPAFDIGFTGTRAGMSPQQTYLLHQVLSMFLWKGRSSMTFRHGACRGADLEAAHIADDCGYTVLGYPAERGEELERNRQIVLASNLLIAAPLGDAEIVRSGTWATVRYARIKGIPIIMLPRGNESIKSRPKIARKRR